MSIVPSPYWGAMTPKKSDIVGTDIERLYWLKFDLEEGLAQIDDMDDVAVAAGLETSLKELRDEVVGLLVEKVSDIILASEAEPGPTEAEAAAGLGALFG